PRQRDGRIGRQPEEKRPAVVVFTKRLEPAWATVLAGRQCPVDVVEDEEPALGIDRERAAGRDTVKPRGVWRERPVGRQAVDAGPVLLADEQLARGGVEREAPQRRRPARAEAQPDRGAHAEVDRESSAQVHAI